MRPILSTKWIAKTGQASPIEFEKLLGLIEDPILLEEIRNLVALKRNTPELGLAPARRLLNEYIEKFLAEENLVIPKKSESAQIVHLLNQIFHNMLRDFHIDR